MPYPSGTLSAFMRRDAQDHMLFAWVHAMRRGMRRALPGVTEERVVDHVPVEAAVRDFADFFGLSPHEFNIDSQRKRYGRMIEEFHEHQRTKVETPATNGQHRPRNSNR